MKRMRIANVLLILLLLAFSSATAQKKLPGSPEERAKKLTEWMKTNLQLNDDQVGQVQPINLKYANKMQELENSTQSKRQKMQTLKANDQAKDAELKNVFTADQYQTYQSKKEEMKKVMKEKIKEKRKVG